jgi:hypothetical protein
VTLLLAAALQASAQAPSEVPVTPANAISSQTIRGIVIERLNVFDPTVPGEGNWAFRMANKIHIATKDEVVRRELLLGPGDQYSALKALESERNLRSLGFFRRAEIKPTPRADGGTDLTVRTQDSWTTNIQFGVGTEGGDSYLNYGFSEDNLFGYGKSVNVLHTQVGPKITNSASYFDPRFMGSRFRFTPYVARTNHGDTVGTEVVQPFFSLDTLDAKGAFWNRSIDEQIVYKDGGDYSKFLLADRTVQAGYGVRVPSDQTLVQRLEAGWFSQRDLFISEDATVAGTLPSNREMSGPMAGFSWVQPQYIKETYVDKMERVEDFNLGNELSLYGGYSGQTLGGDRDRVLINALDQQGLFILPGRFALAQAGVNGRLADSKWENALFFTNLNLFWKTTWLYPQTWVAHFEANTGRSLDLENQIILGGNNGLRGYKNYSFTGARSLLLNVENRFFFPGEYFHLVRFGGAAFFDSGCVVPEGSGFSFARSRSDVGLGLRFASTRSESGSVVRADVAYALNSGPGGSRVVVSIRGQQAFQIFNSSTGSVRTAPRTRLFPRSSTDPIQ